MVFRRSLFLLLASLSLGVAACGGADRPTQVAAGGASATTEASAAASSTTASPSGEAAATTAVVSSTTAAAVPLAADTPADDSPVEGLAADQLRAAVEAPAAAAGRALAGPTVDQVTLADGTRVWRVRVPGRFTARSARVSVTVGGRLVGEAVLAPDLQAITAVTTDGTGLTAGRPVTFQWEGGPSVPAGTLAVTR